jgi:hypothetical protein
MLPKKKPRISTEEKFLSHPLYDHRDYHFHRPDDCPDPLCLLDVKEPGICNKCPRQLENTAVLTPVSASPPPPNKKPGWGGKRRGAGLKRGTPINLKHGGRSTLIRRAVDILAKNKELRPFLLLIARAAIDGEIPQTTRRLIIQSLGKTTTGMLSASSQLKRLRNA